MKSTLYDSRRPLVCREYKEVDRQIGVLVSGPFPHMGRNGQPHVDVELERLNVNTISFGTIIPETEWKEVTAKYTQSIIDHLDVAIKELQEHRERLSGELVKLSAGPEKESDRAAPTDVREPSA